MTELTRLTVLTDPGAKELVEAALMQHFATQQRKEFGCEFWAEWWKKNACCAGATQRKDEGAG